MREIKLRAWHKKNKKFVYFDPEVMKKDRYAADHFFTLMQGNHPDGVLEQFTGLYDCNEKPIYEGDRVLINYNPRQEYEVVWEQYGAYFRCKVADGERGLSWNAYPDLRTEIIGTIHD